MNTYKRLSRVYDPGWSGFALKYTDLVTSILEERGLKSARILDLACGTGTLAVNLAKLGHTVHGIDISPEMIEIARAKSAGLSGVSFEIQNMADLHVKGKFDLVTCGFDSINYLNVEDLRTMFEGVSKALRNSGIFLFDSITHHFCLNHDKYHHTGRPGGEFLIQETSYNPTRQEFTAQFTFPDGVEEVHCQHPYDLADLEPLLSEAGLKLIDHFAGFEKRPDDSQTDRLFCIAEKIIRQTRRPLKEQP
jgi:2-polyprenyl-3-methyl-5-hydroxy-6-metoxy-1,4-benzoquinol methylase